MARAKKVVEEGVENTTIEITEKNKYVKLGIACVAGTALIVPCVVVGKFVGAIGGVAAGALVAYSGAAYITDKYADQLIDGVKNGYNSLNLRNRFRTARTDHPTEVVPAENVAEDVVPKQRARRSRTA